MQNNQASASALVAAFSRAYHTAHDQPLIFSDPRAAELFSPAENAFFRQNLAHAIEAIDPQQAAKIPDQAGRIAWVMQHFSAAITLSRGRYTEDSLRSALQAQPALGQYVILGAGLDTFAWREPALMQHLKVFAVDHPATQADLRRRTAAAGWEQADHLKLVACDFNRQNVAAVLLQAGYDAERPGFFSWLGVSYYLPRASFEQTLKQLAGLAASGSSLIFDYLEQAAFAPETVAARVATMRRFAERMGEPMLTGFAPDTLQKELLPSGWRLGEDLDPAAIEKRFFHARSDDYHAFEQIHFARLQRHP